MQPSGSSYTLVIRNATLAGADRASSVDIGVNRSHVTAIEPHLETTDSVFEIDARGKLVCAGLIDLHGHFYVGGTVSSVNADLACLPFGVTTAVDGGSAGAHTFAAFMHGALKTSHTRLLAFLNISAMGMASSPLSGELHDIALADIGLAVELAAQCPDYIIGFKARLSLRATGTEANAREALGRVVRAGELTGLPVMVHIAQSAIPLDEVFAALRPGDIATHAYAGGGETILDGDQVASYVTAAVDRGVALDLGHAVVNMDFEVAHIAIEHGVVPTTLSTDAHHVRAGVGSVTVVDTMTQMVALGLPLEAAIAAVTRNPASAIQRSAELGQLAIGRVADITVLDVRDDRRIHRDHAGSELVTESSISAAYTIKSGRLFSDL